jgi:hypothetical protein
MDFLKAVEKQAIDLTGGARKKIMGDIEPKPKNDPTEDDYFEHMISPGSFLQTKSKFSAPVYKGIKSKGTKKPSKAREIIFNVLDHDMTGNLDMKEFFELIKY